jgi:hypothetical protein
MELTATGPKSALVLVQAGPECGWRVLLPGAAKSRFFLDRAPALSYAKAWAAANRPSAMHVSGAGGNFTHGWSFR